jgi:hypothetical protein
MRALLHLELTTSDGSVVDTRDAHNTVLRSGGELVANLFSGGAGPITHMAVGTSDADPTATEMEALANDDGEGGAGLTGATRVAIPPELFRISVDETSQRVVVRVRATLPEDAAIGTVREAALVSRQGEDDVLYNRVVFPPIDKADDHDLTLFWEVEFPFGDLQWLVQ